MAQLHSPQVSKPRKGKKFSEAHKQKISKALKGRVFSIETRKKMSEKLKKRMQNVSNEYRQKMSISLMGNDHLLGYKHTEESKSKISKSLRKHHHCVSAE